MLLIYCRCASLAVSLEMIRIFRSWKLQAKERTANKQNSVANVARISHTNLLSLRRSCISCRWDNCFADWRARWCWDNNEPNTLYHQTEWNNFSFAHWLKCNARVLGHSESIFWDSARRIHFTQCLLTPFKCVGLHKPYRICAPIVEHFLQYYNTLEPIIYPWLYYSFYFAGCCCVFVVVFIVIPSHSFIANVCFLCFTHTQPAYIPAHTIYPISIHAHADSHLLVQSKWLIVPCAICFATLSQQAKMLRAAAAAASPYTHQWASVHSQMAPPIVRACITLQCSNDHRQNGTNNSHISMKIDPKNPQTMIIN